MTKKFSLTLALVFSSFMIVNLCEAGLINYDRRNKTVSEGTTARARTPSYRANRYNSSSAAVSTPSWERSSPSVNNRTERRYDLNKDRALQASEVRTFLKDVIDFVEARGGMRVNSEILRDYDSNGDGVINQAELSMIRRHIGR